MYYKIIIKINPNDDNVVLTNFNIKMLIVKFNLFVFRPNIIFNSCKLKWVDVLKTFDY